jgi:hypothetical protein
MDPSSAETLNSTAEDDDIAFAAEAAANAVAAADAEQQRLDESLLSCRICGSGSAEGRPILRFLPVEHDMAAATAAPSVTSFTEDIALHIFCGKTASILPSVNQPELEILTKAGLKNKHGIGPEVNASLARTRCAILQQDGAKEKHYYLVREFEAHLAAIRHTHITFVSDNHHHANQNLNQNQNQNHHPYSTTSTATTTTTHNPADHHLPHHHRHHMVEPTHLVQEELSTSTSTSTRPMTMTMTVPLQQQADNNDHFCSSDFSPPSSSFTATSCHHHGRWQGALWMWGDALADRGRTRRCQLAKSCHDQATSKMDGSQWTSWGSLANYNSIQFTKSIQY